MLKDQLRQKVAWIAVFAVLSSFSMATAYAAPDGGQIVGGSGGINQSGLTTTINQNSASMAIHWNGFDIQQNEIVNFVQPNASSIALNQILSNSASQIRGQINANGHIVLVNPNGLFFGQKEYGVRSIIYHISLIPCPNVKTPTSGIYRCALSCPVLSNIVAYLPGI